MMFKKIQALALISLLGATLSGCQTLAQQITDEEDLLADAGFVVLPANNAARIAQLKSLPANRFITKTEAGVDEYIFADPVVCQCLYRGDRLALEIYRNEVLTRELQDEESMNAMMYDDTWGWDGWDWGHWRSNI